MHKATVRRSTLGATGARWFGQGVLDEHGEQDSEECCGGAGHGGGLSLKDAFRGYSCSCKETSITAEASPPPLLVGTDEAARAETPEVERKKNQKTGGGVQGVHGGLDILFGIEPEGCNSVGEAGEWTEVEFAVDSGATETAMNQDILKIVETKDGVAAKRGVVYEVANGIRIPNLGEKRFVGYTAEGGGREVLARVCNANNALLSVRRMVAAGNRVVFGDQSYIESMTTGERVCLEENEGMYMVNMWIKSDVFFDGEAQEAY